jgi:hypothetical protein
LEKFGLINPLYLGLALALINPWIAPLINGRPTPFFKASRGLRKGCPLSPMLYVLMVEALNRILEQE